MTPIGSAAMKVGLSFAATAILSVRMARSAKSPAWFGLTRPPLLPSLAFLAIYLAWMLGTDALLGWRGPWDLAPWRSAPLLASALRLLAVCLFGPIVEELLFRGVLFAWLRERLPIAAVILLTSVGWALLHWSYSWAVIGVIAVDGVILGLARWRTASVYPPIVMHMLYNLYAIW